ncbi:MAG: MotA/TolQ/ExbB proton channel family protein [Deltaproteobacteria bacterium]|jgi:biopolymer transport protein ExbB/TolQ|nr:MotA/TolQ/ExbB proton channel family protein [Deltaproteobacteria bacterium]
MPTFSVVDMFLAADDVVKAVMLLLILASVASWVIIIEKTIVLRSVSRQILKFKRLTQQINFQILPEEYPGFTSLIVEAGVVESADTAGNETRADYRERVERSMRGILSSRVYRLEARVTLLATTGSTCPFIGLFGTVWGIMNSFIGIAASGETTLSVVAPGIAEALSATAMGLVAAIPAVIAFNKINSTVKKISKEALAGIGLVGNCLARFHFEKKTDLTNN